MNKIKTRASVGYKLCSQLIMQFPLLMCSRYVEEQKGKGNEEDQIANDFRTTPCSAQVLETGRVYESSITILTNPLTNIFLYYSAVQSQDDRRQDFTDCQKAKIIH